MFDAIETETVTLAAQEAARRLQTAITETPDIFKAVFGPSTALDSVLQGWLESGVPLHDMIIVTAAQIPGADAAYDRSTDTILLSDSFVSSASSERLEDAIVEELGHRLDAALGGDTSGDEGQSLVAALRGEPVPVTTEDYSDETRFEYTTSVNDSGGFEGSSKILPL